MTQVSDRYNIDFWLFKTIAFEPTYLENRWLRRFSPAIPEAQFAFKSAYSASHWRDPMIPLQNLNEKGVALQGFDPVSYFSGQPVEGQPELTTTYEGAIYRFSSEENKAKFEANPQDYLPQYGGFCAVAISEGKTFPIDPQTYRVTDNKLYLFYNGKLGNTKPQWDADEETRRTNADRYWQNKDIKFIYPTKGY